VVSAAAVVVVVEVVVALLVFDYDCNNLLNGVLYSPLDPKEHQHIHDEERTKNNFKKIYI
jgi:hypothetical protein